MSQRQISNFTPERTEDNDPDLWPTGWDVGPHPALPDVAPEYIDPVLLPYYRRTAEGDAKVRAEYENGPTNPATGTLLPVSVADPDNLLHANGRPISFNPGTETGLDLLSHYHALRVAKARRDEERRVELETTRDRVEFTCAACGRLDRVEVRARVIGAWGHRREEQIRPEIKLVERGPRMCDACHRVTLKDLDDRRRAVAVASAAEELDDGTTRGDRVRLWIDGNIERIMKS